MRRLTIELPDELADDLERCADWHGVPVDDVVRHAVAADIEFAREHGLGPWEPVSRGEAKRPLPPDVLIDALQDTVHTEVGRVRVAVTVRRVK